MRYVVYLLLIANLGLFAWIYSRPVQEAPVSRVAPLPSGIDTLVLLSERTAVAPTAQVTAVGVSPPGPGLDDIAVPSVDIPVPDNAVEAEQPQVDVQTEIAPIEQTPEQIASEELPVVAFEPEPEPEPEPVCISVGPLPGEREAVQVAALLSSHGYSPSQRSDKVRQPSGYWIYMPAMPAAEARRIVATLDENGMKDYFIGKKNHISLGIFSRKQQAQRRLDRINALGFDAVLDRRYRVRTVYWLDLEDGEPSLENAAVWQEIQSTQTDIRIQQASCE